MCIRDRVVGVRACERGGGRRCGRTLLVETDNMAARGAVGKMASKAADMHRGGYCQFLWHIFTESKIPHFRFHFFTLLASQRRVKTTMAARLLRRAFGWFLRCGDSEQFFRDSSH